ncbi:MAG TPA: DUF58 domain-containing protein [Isosphaeraceae bacterium]
MASEARSRPGPPRRPTSWLLRWFIEGLWPNQQLRWTREGAVYLGVWGLLLMVGLYQQINLILLIAGLAAGPVAASVFVSASMLRRLRIARRVPAYVFSGEPLRLEYTLQNDRRWTAALALHLQDELNPVDRTIAGAGGVLPRVFFPRVAALGRERVRWEGPSPKRGRYRFRTLDLATRSPFGLFERRVTLPVPDELIVYPTIGHLTRRWHIVEREASEARRGQRHDRATAQQEYHGLRDYRPGDSPRWIHWRTSARLGQPMVKEFEQQHEQDLAVLIDPWLPRTKVTPEQREHVEDAIKFVATLCYETCRQAGRRLTLGWTGSTPGLRQGPSSIKLLHEFLEQLATMRATSEGGLAPLLDALPPATLREAIFVVVSTRPINLHEEAEQTSRLSGASSRGLFSRVTLLDVSRGDLADFIQSGEAPGLVSADRARPIWDPVVSVEPSAHGLSARVGALDGAVEGPFSTNGTEGRR